MFYVFDGAGAALLLSMGTLISTLSSDAGTPQRVSGWRPAPRKYKSPAPQFAGEGVSLYGAILNFCTLWPDVVASPPNTPASPT
jgi:hypothetical protein